MKFKDFIIFVPMNDVELNIGTIKDLCENHEVDRLYLFGSILSNKFNSKSDIDFLVKFKNIDLLQYAITISILNFLWKIY